jgi:hypothetical protein
MAWVPPFIEEIAESSNDPFRLARAFSDAEGKDAQGRPTLRFWKGEWYRYRDGHYVIQEEGSIRVELTGFIKNYFDANKCVDSSRFFVRQVTTALVANTLQALASMAAVHDSARSAGNVRCALSAYTDH